MFRKQPAAMLAIQRLAGVASEMDLGEYMLDSCIHPPSLYRIRLPICPFKLFTNGFATLLKGNMKATSFFKEPHLRIEWYARLYLCYTDGLTSDMVARFLLLFLDAGVWGFQLKKYIISMRQWREMFSVRLSVDLSVWLLLLLVVLVLRVSSLFLSVQWAIV